MQHVFCSKVTVYLAVALVVSLCSLLLLLNVTHAVRPASSTKIPSPHGRVGEQVDIVAALPPVHLLNKPDESVAEAMLAFNISEPLRGDHRLLPANTIALIPSIIPTVIDMTTMNHTAFQRIQPCAAALPRTMPLRLLHTGYCGNGSADSEQTCGCSAQVVTVHHVVWQTFQLEAKKVFTLALTKVASPLEGRRLVHAIDRSDVTLAAARCRNLIQGLAPTNLEEILRDISKVVDQCASWEHLQLVNGSTTGHLTSDRNASVVERKSNDTGSGSKTGSGGNNLTEVYYALSTTESFPGHNLEAVIEALAQYYASGLYQRRVPWIVPEYPVKGINPGLRGQLLEFGQLLDIPMVSFPAGQPFFAPTVHFASLQFGQTSMCYKPFIQNVLWPRVVEEAAKRGLKPLPRVATIKALGSSGTYTANRAFKLTPKFQRLAASLGMPIFIHPLSLVEKLYYFNTADTIVTTWGASTAFVFLLMIPRKVNVFILVHKRYAAEYGIYPGLHRASGARRSLLVERRTRIEMFKSGWDMMHSGLVVRLLSPRSLDDVTSGDMQFT